MDQKHQWYLYPVLVSTLKGVLYLYQSEKVVWNIPNAFARPLSFLLAHCGSGIWWVDSHSVENSFSPVHILSLGKTLKTPNCSQRFSNQCVKGSEYV